VTARRIVTIAGSPTSGLFSGDGQPAVRAGLGAPTALAIDSARRVYIAERELGARAHGSRAIIRRIEWLDRRVQWVAGSGETS